MSLTQKSLEGEQMDFHEEKLDEPTTSTDGLTAQERTALTRRVLLKLDFR